jgi:hypothetical protein
MMEDVYWPVPKATYEDRRQRYLAYCAERSPGGRTGFFSQIARLALGRDPVDEEPVRDAIAFVDSRRDCCDFSVGGLLRILYLYHDSPQISPDLIVDIENCLLRFKYWWDEPQGDNHRCYHTENHQIIFHSDELLSGQLFRDRVFQNSGQKGQYHIDHAAHLIRRWMDFRFRFGFSEWLSNCYFEEDLLALVNLVDFSQDAEIRAQAEMLIDLILMEMALHTYRGIFGSTHGRTCARLIKGARGEGSASTAKLMFGMGLFNDPSSLGTVPLATSSYRCPPVISKIAADLDEALLFRERHSINMVDAPRYGLSYDDELDGHLYWSIQDYCHPEVIGLSRRLSEKYGVRLHEDYEQRYQQLFRWQIEQYGEIVDKDLDCHALTEVDIQTYRTPTYMLSCAQDYRPGKPGYQQHTWQATLGIDAVAFTNHPGAEDETSRPNYWAGNGVMPRAAQHRNVLVCIYRLPADDPYPFSHLYFPRNVFDQVVERGPWVCARKGEGMVALYAQHPLRWPSDTEARVDVPNNVWVCEMGDLSQWGSFPAFVEAVTGAEIACQGLGVRYVSPSLGAVSFGWEEPLQIAGRVEPLHGYERFDNPYCRCAFGAPEVVIRRGEDELYLDLARGQRTLCSR